MKFERLDDGKRERNFGDNGEWVAMRRVIAFEKCETEMKLYHHEMHSVAFSTMPRQNRELTTLLINNPARDLFACRVCMLWRDGISNATTDWHKVVRGMVR